MIQKILHYTVDLPLNILRDLTIPPCENYAFNKYFFSLIPLCAPLFILFTTSYFYLLYELYILIGYLVIGSLIGVGLFFNSFDNKVPKFVIMLCTIAFIMSIFWIWFTSSFLVDVLTSFGILFGIPKAVLGMTMLVLGNSIPDMTLDIILAKNGFGEMAISGVIGGPLFNIIVGLGIIFIRLNLTTGLTNN